MVSARDVGHPACGTPLADCPVGLEQSLFRINHKGTIAVRVSNHTEATRMSIARAAVELMANSCEEVNAKFEAFTKDLTELSLRHRIGITGEPVVGE